MRGATGQPKGNQRMATGGNGRRPSPRFRPAATREESTSGNDWQRRRPTHNAEVAGSSPAGAIDAAAPWSEVRSSAVARADHRGQSEGNHSTQRTAAAYAPYSSSAAASAWMCASTFSRACSAVRPRSIVSEVPPDSQCWPDWSVLLATQAPLSKKYWAPYETRSWRIGRYHPGRSPTFSTRDLYSVRVPYQCFSATGLETSRSLSARNFTPGLPAAAIRARNSLAARFKRSRSTSIAACSTASRSAFARASVALARTASSNSTRGKLRCERPRRKRIQPPRTDRWRPGRVCRADALSACARNIGFAYAGEHRIRGVDRRWRHRRGRAHPLRLRRHGGLRSLAAVGAARREDRARLVRLDLALAASQLKAAEDEGTWWVFYSTHMEGWESHRASLAARLTKRSSRRSRSRSRS